MPILASKQLSGLVGGCLFDFSIFFYGFLYFGMLWLEPTTPLGGERGLSGYLVLHRLLMMGAIFGIAMMQFYMIVFSG